MEFNPQTKGTFKRSITGLSKMSNLRKTDTWRITDGGKHYRTRPVRDRNRHDEMYSVNESEMMHVGKIPWIVECEKEHNSYRFYFGKIEEEEGGDVEAEFWIRIKSQSSGIEDIVKNWRSSNMNLFHFEDYSCLFYEAEIDELSNYIEKDTIHFECDIEMKRAAYVGCWEIDFFSPTKLSDAVIVFGGKRIHVNRKFLSIHSEYFERLFRKEGNGEDEYEVESDDPKGLIDLLRFIYPGGNLLVEDFYLDYMLKASKEMGFLQHVKNVVTELYMTEEIKVDYHHWYPFSKYFSKTVEQYELTQLHKDLLESLSKEECERLLTESQYKDIPDQSKRDILKKHTELVTKIDDDGQAMETENQDFNSSDYSNPTKFSDVVLIVEGKKCHVSKILMAMNSPVFEAMFYSGFRDQHQPEIELKEVNYSEFVALLSLIHPYANRVRIGENNVAEIHRLADRFDVTRVLQHCERYLNKLKKREIAKNVLSEIEDQLSGMSVEY